MKNFRANMLKKDLIAVISVMLIVFMVGGVVVLKKLGKLSSKADTTGPSLTLEPSSGSYDIGANFDVNIRLDTAGQAASLVQINKIHFDPSVLQVVDADSNKDGVQIAQGNITSFETSLMNAVDNTTGTITYSVSSFSNNYTGNDIVAKINFKTIAAGSATPLAWDFDGSLAKTTVNDSTGVNILTSVTPASFNVEAPTPAPTVSLTVDGQKSVTKNSGDSVALAWTNTNTVSCTATSTPTDSNWDGAITPVDSGSKTINSLSQSVNYTLSCTNTSGSVSDTVQVTIGTPPPPPTPTVSLTVDGKKSVTKNSGDSATLAWTSTYASTCTASNGWSGNITPVRSGSKVISSLTTSANYTLTCTGTGGSASGTVQVTVGSTPPPVVTPTVSLRANSTANKITIDSGTSVNLSWITTSAKSCSASGDWSGSKDLNGQAAVGKITSAKKYILTCKNDSGTGYSTVDVSIKTSSGGTTSTPAAVKPSQLTPVTTPQISQLPTTIQPVIQPQAKDNSVQLVANDTMKPWALWFLYAIIPAFLAGGVVYFYLKRKKTFPNTKNEII